MARSAQQQRRAGGSDSVEEAIVSDERTQVGQNHPLRWYQSRAFNSVNTGFYSDARCQFKLTRRSTSLARPYRGFLS